MGGGGRAEWGPKLNCSLLYYLSQPLGRFMRINDSLYIVICNELSLIKSGYD
jgi:hypothetical protein